MLAALAALAPLAIPSSARAEEGRSSGDSLPRLGFRLAGPFSPSLTFAVLADAGHEESLFGPYLSAYRAVPVLRIGIEPEPRVQLFAGGGAGPAYVFPDPLAHAPSWCEARNAVAFSGALGASFPFQGASVRAVARAEAVDGYGATVMLRLVLDLADAK